MMLKQEQAFKTDIAAVCEKYRIGMVGTCGSESIYGEITLFDLDAPESSNWVDIHKYHLNWDS